MASKKQKQASDSVTLVKAKRLLKRDLQPSFPHGMKLSRADSVLIVDFMAAEEDVDYDRSFSSIVVNKDIAMDLLKGLVSYLGEGTLEVDGFSIEIESIKEG